VAPGLAAACAIFADDDPADMDVLAALAELSLLDMAACERGRPPSLVPWIALV
jgi:hypothetical protein